MLVSTFELLLKPITPVEGNLPGSGRTVLQGYFLTVANPNKVDLNLRLRFTATTTNSVLDDTIIFADVTGINNDGNLTTTGDEKKFTYDVKVAGHDTALVIIQPDITELEADDKLEIRGYVEIFLQSPTGYFDVLLTPEHRGTFLNDNRRVFSDYDQLAYSLPTANGGSLFKLFGALKLAKEIKAEIKEIPDVFKAEPDNLGQSVLPEFQETLSLMAQSIDNLERRFATDGRAFISPEERPAVGEGAQNSGSGGME